MKSSIVIGPYLLIWQNPTESWICCAQDKEKEMVKAKGLLGWKPAKYEMKCTKCGHYEAVRVPIVPVNRTETRECFRSTASGIDYSSNYKSMNWKCKCGDMILNHKMPKESILIILSLVLLPLQALQAIGSFEGEFLLCYRRATHLFYYLFQGDDRDVEQIVNMHNPWIKSKFHLLLQEN